MIRTLSIWPSIVRTVRTWATRGARHEAQARLEAACLAVRAARDRGDTRRQHAAEQQARRLRLYALRLELGR